MSEFDALLTAGDDVLLDVMGDPLRWVKSSGATVDLPGIIDRDVEFFGENDDVPFRGITLTARTSDIPDHGHGEKLLALDAAGNPTGTEYRLQRLVSDDGALKTIWITQ